MERFCFWFSLVKFSVLQPVLVSLCLADISEPSLKRHSVYFKNKWASQVLKPKEEKTAVLRRVSFSGHLKTDGRRKSDEERDEAAS